MALIIQEIPRVQELCQKQDEVQKYLKYFFIISPTIEGGEKPEKYINKFINKLKCFQIEYYQENKAG